MGLRLHGAWYAKVSLRRLVCCSIGFLAALAVSCSAPSVVSNFVRADEAKCGVYEFTLELTDTCGLYDLSLYSRAVRADVDNVPLELRWIAPSGAEAREQAYMSAVSREGTKELYRSDIAVKEAGDWKLELKVLDMGEELLGMGIVLEKRH